VTRDAVLVLIAAFVRASTVGVVGLVLAIFLAETGLSVTAIGSVMGAGLAGSALATLVAGFRADGFGRRRTLAALALVTAAGYLALLLSRNTAVLAALAFAGTLNGMGRDRGAASALEQAVLAAVTDDRRRTWIFGWYNVVLDMGHAAGALAGATPVLLDSRLHLGSIRAHEWTFVGCAVAIAASASLYAQLSPRVESPSRAASGRRAPLTSETRRAVTRLALLFGLDSVGGGLLGSALIAYWFFQRFGLSEASLAGLFFTARVLNAAGHVAAAWISRRVGLVNTMVFTHLPSSLFIMAAPLAPSAGAASALFLCREALVEMDVPTRQSYVMAIVAPEERAVVSSVTNMTRSLGWAVGPLLAGVAMQLTLAGPLLIGGGLKVAYDLLLYRSFRHLKAPEERVS
jgi:MFS family permease